MKSFLNVSTNSSCSASIILFLFLSSFFAQPRGLILRAKNSSVINYNCENQGASDSDRDEVVCDQKTSHSKPCEDNNPAPLKKPCVESCKQVNNNIVKEAPKSSLLLELANTEHGLLQHVMDNVQVRDLTKLFITGNAHLSSKMLNIYGLRLNEAAAALADQYGLTKNLAERFAINPHQIEEYLFYDLIYVTNIDSEMDSTVSAQENLERIPGSWKGGLLEAGQFEMRPFMDRAAWVFSRVHLQPEGMNDVWLSQINAGDLLNSSISDENNLLENYNVHKSFNKSKIKLQLVPGKNGMKIDDFSCVLCFP